jgi:tetratricopeptide (TPR) repeat protein
MASYRNKGKKGLKQPDEFITFSSRLLQQVVLYKARILAGLGILVAVVLIASGIGYLSRRADNKSLLLLAQAVARYESIQTEKGAAEAHKAVKDDFQKLIDSYGNKAGGKLSKLFLASSCYAAGEYDQAAQLYGKAETAFKGEAPLELMASFGVGYSLEQKGDTNAALDVFTKIPTGEKSVLGDEALFVLARLYKAQGKTDKEKEVSRKLIETFPNSIYIDLIKESHPEFAQQKS